MPTNTSRLMADVLDSARKATEEGRLAWTSQAAHCYTFTVGGLQVYIEGPSAPGGSKVRLWVTDNLDNTLDTADTDDRHLAVTLQALYKLVRRQVHKTDGYLRGLLSALDALEQEPTP